MTKELPSGGNARLAAPELPRQRGVAAPSPLSEPGGAQLSLPASGRERLAQSPTVPGVQRICRGTPRGSRTLRSQRTRMETARGERKRNSSHLTGAEELGGAGVCLGFPNCKQPATETTLLAQRSLQAP